MIRANGTPDRSRAAVKRNGRPRPRRVYPRQRPRRHRIQTGRRALRTSEANLNRPGHRAHRQLAPGRHARPADLVGRSVSFLRGHGTALTSSVPRLDSSRRPNRGRRGVEPPPCGAPLQHRAPHPRQRHGQVGPRARGARIRPDRPRRDRRRNGAGHHRAKARAARAAAIQSGAARVEPVQRALIRATDEPAWLDRSATSSSTKPGIASAGLAARTATGRTPSP